jgi:N-acetylglucosamine kinase-like BadF-type ATPase
VDSGGTKCDALLAREDGAVLRWRRVYWNDPASSSTVVGGGRSLSAISSAIRQVLGDIECRELHVAGISHKLEQVLHLCGRHAAVIKAYHIHEGDPSYAQCEQTWGMVAIAGTGAVIQMRKRDGSSFRLDGLGPYLGDYGGAFHIGMQAIRAVGRFEWAPRYHTSLVEPVFEALGLLNGGPPRAHQLLVYMIRPPADRAVIASLARLVDEQARAGDRIARAILHEAATAMAETILCVVEQAGYLNEACPLIGHGSVAQCSTIFWDHLCARVRAYAPNIVPMLPPFPPVVGAALIVLHRLAPDNHEALRRTLFTSAAKMQP